MTAEVEKISVLLVDDHIVVRRGLRHLLAATADIEVIGEAANGADALRLAAELAPDVILLDVRMPGQSGFEVAPRLRQMAPRARIIMLTSYEDDEYITKSFGGGADGYLLKSGADELLAAAIRAVCRGERLVTPRLMTKVLSQFQSLSQTQARLESGIDTGEHEILQRLERGETNAQIAGALYLGERTLKRRIQQIYRKLDVANRTQAIAEAARRGLL